MYFILFILFCCCSFCLKKETPAGQPASQRPSWLASQPANAAAQLPPPQPTSREAVRSSVARTRPAPDPPRLQPLTVGPAPLSSSPSRTRTHRTHTRGKPESRSHTRAAPCTPEPSGACPRPRRTPAPLSRSLPLPHASARVKRISPRSSKSAAVRRKFAPP